MLYRHNDQLTTMQNFMQIDFFNNLHNLQQQCNNSRLTSNKKERTYVQASYIISDEATRKREFLTKGL